MTSDTYDIVIVGGGTAGLVLASRLSEDPNLQVVAIEAGADMQDDPRVNVPAMWHSLIKSSSDWNFDTIPQESLHGRKLPFPQGRVLGGTSAINGLIFTPPPRSNIEGWAKLGNPGWDWPSFSKSLRKAFSLADKLSGTETSKCALQVSYPDQSQNEWPSIWKATLAGLGFSVQGDLFTGNANGLVVNPEAIHPETRKRSFSQNAYLAPALHRGNLTIMPDTLVSKVLFSKSESGEAIAEGIQYNQDGEIKMMRARKEVVICAGVINSPLILERSGIGAAELLQNLGIEVIVNNPNVGENLQNHLMVTVSSEVKDGIKTMDPLRRRDPDVLEAARHAYGKQSGPLATSGTSVTGQLPFPGIQTEEGKKELEQLFATNLNAKVNRDKSTPAFDQAHKEFVCSILSSPEEASGCYITLPSWAAFNPDGSLAPPPNGEQGYFSIALLSTHPLSRGSTHIASVSSLSPDRVAIDPGYLSHPLDVEIFARNLRFLETLLAAEPLSSQFKQGWQRNPSAPLVAGFTDLDKARAYVRDTGLGGNHFVGSCSMMPREIGGVVDSQLRVYGTRNLRVCDASIIPLIPRANPQATVYGVAEHGANIIKSAM